MAAGPRAVCQVVLTHRARAHDALCLEVQFGPFYRDKSQPSWECGVCMGPFPTDPRPQPPRRGHAGWAPRLWFDDSSPQPGPRFGETEFMACR